MRQQEGLEDSCLEDIEKEQKLRVFFIESFSRQFPPHPLLRIYTFIETVTHKCPGLTYASGGQSPFCTSISSNLSFPLGLFITNLLKFPIPITILTFWVKLASILFKKIFF